MAIFDIVNEFKRDFLSLLKDCNNKLTPAIIKNHQANSLFERVHQVLGNMSGTKKLLKYDFVDMDPWTKLLASVAQAIWNTHQTTPQATPVQLVFGRDVLFNLKIVSHRKINCPTECSYLIAQVY